MASKKMLQPFRILLIPFSILYWLGIFIRNWCYNKNILKSTSFGLPLICVGNLAVGGTGKSPMVEYLVSNLKDKTSLAILSRGYKRRTVGYALADNDSTALDIGDEPMQFHLKFPEVAVAVGEQRVEAIPQLLHDKPATKLIILDDAFQHRAIKAGFNILLTDYNNLFTRDFYLPAGNLRDQKSSYKRADIIVVTKCDPQLNTIQKHKLIREINPLVHQSVFFTSFEYGMPYHFLSKERTVIEREAAILMVTGIANPRPLTKMLKEKFENYSLLQYADHHIFSIDDLKKIKATFSGIEKPKKIILTTEKDAVRLFKFNEEIKDLPLFILPVRHHFLFEEEKKINSVIFEFINNFKLPT